MKLSGPLAIALSVTLVMNTTFALTPEMQRAAQAQLVKLEADRLEAIVNLGKFRSLLLGLEMDLSSPEYNKIQFAQKVTTALSTAALVYWFGKGMNFGAKSSNLFFTITTILNGLTHAATVGIAVNVRKLSSDLKTFSGLLQSSVEVSSADRIRFSAQLETLAKQIENASGSELTTLIFKSGSILTFILSTLNVLVAGGGATSSFPSRLYGGLVATSTGILSAAFSVGSLLSEPDRKQFIQEITNLREQTDVVLAQLKQRK